MSRTIISRTMMMRIGIAIVAVVTLGLLALPLARAVAGLAGGGV
jgi:hypothetical protein